MADESLYPRWGIIESSDERSPLEIKLEEAKSPEYLDNLLTYLMTTRDEETGLYYITEDEYKDYYEKYFPIATENYIDSLGLSQEAKKDLYQFQGVNLEDTKRDLADKLLKLNLPPTETDNIYKWLSQSPDLAIRGARGRATTAVEDRARVERQSALEQKVWELSQNPYTKELLKTITPAEEEAYLRGEPSNLIGKLDSLWQQADINLKAQYKEAGQAQRAERSLAGMQEFGRPIPEGGEIFQRPPITGAEKAVTSFLEGTGLDRGTRLRQFLEGEFLPDVLGGTRSAREDWWKKIYPEPPVRGRDVASEIATMQEESRRWAELAGIEPSGTPQGAWEGAVSGVKGAWEGAVSGAKDKGASREQYLGNVDYGPGGLQAMAERAYYNLQETLAEKVPAQQRLARGAEYLGGQEAYESRRGALTGEQRRDLVSAGMETYPSDSPAHPINWATMTPQQQESWRRANTPSRPEDPLKKALRERDYKAEYYRRPGTGLVRALTPAVRY